MSAPALLYTRAGCPYCLRVRESLAAESTPFQEIDVSRHPEKIPELLKLTGGRRVVPVLVRDGRIEVAPHGATTF